MIRYLRCRAVCERFGISRSSLYAWISQGRFPAPVHLGPRLVAWSIETLNAWEQSRAG